jgi:hypothetical protein
MRREADEGSVVSSGSGDRAPEVLQIRDDYANQVRCSDQQCLLRRVGCVCHRCGQVWRVRCPRMRRPPHHDLAALSAAGHVLCLKAWAPPAAPCTP